MAILPDNSGRKLSLAEKQAAAEQMFSVSGWGKDSKGKPCGFMTCPGIDGHSTPTKRDHTRVYVEEGTPSIDCSHTSCTGLIESAEFQLRSYLGKLATSGGGAPRFVPSETPKRKEEAPNEKRAFAPLPVPSPLVDPTISFLRAMFQPGEFVAFSNLSLVNGRLAPVSQETIERDAFIEKITTAGGIKAMFPNSPGMYVRVNPVIKGGSGDHEVTAYRHVLVEIDADENGATVPRETQFGAIVASGLPVTVVTFSGGKSLHALVRVDAASFEEHKERGAEVLSWFRQFLPPDEKCFNPSRYSRMPGAQRLVSALDDARKVYANQELLAVGIGPATWRAWETAHPNIKSVNHGSTASPQALADGAPDISAGAFPVDSFPELLRRYAGTLSDTYQVPPALFLMMMLGAVSGAAGKGWRLVDAAPGWSNYPNLYILLGLETGSFKSVVGRIIKPITEAEKRRLKEWETQRVPVLRGRLVKAQKDLKSLSNDATDAARGELCKEIAKIEKQLLRNPALMFGSCTTAALAQCLSATDHELAMLYSPEGGDLIRVALGIYRESGMDADLLLSGFTGESYGQSRAGSGTQRLEEPVLSILGMIQPILIREATNHEEARERGLLGRLLCVPLEHPTPRDDGNHRVVDMEVEAAWQKRLGEILNGRFENNAEPLIVRCSPDAQSALRMAHNQSVDWVNGVHQDLRAWLVRYREISCRVALCLQIAEDPQSLELSGENAKRAVSIVHWCVAQLVDMLHAGRTDILRERLERLRELVSKVEFVSLRDLRRKGFSAAEVQQLCLLEDSHLEYYVHQAETGAPPSPRVRRRSQSSPLAS
ncbi:MAG: DUF3987 domain-containing protein [Verrucomicrobiota bacterium]